jgi:hypothetical protein
MRPGPPRPAITPLIRHENNQEKTRFGQEKTVRQKILPLQARQRTGPGAPPTLTVGFLLIRQSERLQNPFRCIRRTVKILRRER